jgi:hypothetical protein
VTSGRECAGTRQLLGVYLVGAIEPADRAAADWHLARCAECQRELAGLAALPALLSRVSAAEAGGLSADGAEGDRRSAAQPGTDLPRLLARAARVRRVRRRRSVAAAAAAVVIVGAGAAAAGQELGSASPASGQPAWTTVSARDAGTLASATVGYSPRAWGTALKVQVGQVAAGTACQLWVTNSRGQQAIAGGWAVTPGGPVVWYPASVPFPAATVRSFELVADGRILVTVPVARSR